jgi:pimeloyl-ACP methyl ester carboxylesterase
MPSIQTNGATIYYEEAGSGFPVIFCHETAGDMRSWEPQMRHFARRYRVIAFNYRGYPPSSVPDDLADYSHDILIDDLHALMGALGIRCAHLVGIATGGNLSLGFAIKYPAMVAGLVLCGTGAGTGSGARERWLAWLKSFCEDVARDGADGIVANVAGGAQRVIFREKDPRGWATFIETMRTLSPKGLIGIMSRALVERPPIFDLEAELRGLQMPILVMVGDQDEPAFAPSRFIRDRAPFAGLAVLPMSGHTINLEEIVLFNHLLGNFLAGVDAGHWGNWRASP